MSAGRWIDGFTLVETLAVSVIVALGAAVVAASMRSGTVGAVGAQGVLWSVGAADQRARVESLGRGGVVLEVTNGAIVVRTDRAEAVLHREELPRRSQVRMSVDGEETTAVRFDRAGRCADYVVDFDSGDGRGRARVSGTTGWIEDERESEG
ncbi:MAG: prepilin-type N-terminal cleavage/methylation domain-containing protein [Phycisphaeraceae bacterium]|nr:prepilin-type N-terminal cleavage/methylation domain-containing protein [Phycisphaeraceae bacterium]